MGTVTAPWRSRSSAGPATRGDRGSAMATPSDDSEFAVAFFERYGTTLAAAARFMYVVAIRITAGSKVEPAELVNSFVVDRLAESVYESTPIDHPFQLSPAFSAQLSHRHHPGRAQATTAARAGDAASGSAIARTHTGKCGDRGRVLGHGTSPPGVPELPADPRNRTAPERENVAHHANLRRGGRGHGLLEGYRPAALLRGHR